MRRRAVDDPVGFVDALPRPAAIDEFQRAGEGLLLAVKQAADLDTSPGQLLLAGSANYLADRSVSQTLAERAGRLVLWPFSAGSGWGCRRHSSSTSCTPTAGPHRPLNRCRAPTCASRAKAASRG